MVRKWSAMSPSLVETVNRDEEELMLGTRLRSFAGNRISRFQKGTRGRWLIAWLDAARQRGVHALVTVA